MRRAAACMARGGGLCFAGAAPVRACAGPVYDNQGLTHKNIHVCAPARPPPLEALEDGPDQAECDALLAEEMARAKQLEAVIASSEVSHLGGGGRGLGAEYCLAVCCVLWRDLQLAGGWC